MAVINFMMIKLVSVFSAAIFLLGCASTPKSTAPKYDSKTGTYKKTYTTGELGGHFVRDLLGISSD